MIQTLKHKLAYKAYLRLQKNNPSKTIEDLNRIGLIIDPTVFDDPADTKTLIETFEAWSDRTSVILVSPPKQIDLKKVMVYNQNQLNYLGSFKKGSDAEKFKSEKFDLLINYFNRVSAGVLLLSASVRADLRIGLSTEEGALNAVDMLVNPNEIPMFVRGIKQYLPKINQA